ncbi:hypothetical protein [Colwellia sp. E2M01]|uniref:hypothetical protein n=1 Tax=Colwellia sp. E2M01 TaxID=2841561 RepID=UPI001C0998F8|nr:hypothetical protein [Colwellia sp. E2M01]MBU2871844.1 hypothetical protein [Colwellia sp. E2M01]
MTEPAPKKPEQTVPPAHDTDPLAVLSAWEKTFYKVKTQLSCYATLIATDFQLSLKAIVLVAACIATAAFLGMVIWVILLIGLSYGLNSLGLDWLWCWLVVLGVNISALLIVKNILTNAMQSVEMKTSANVIFNAGKEMIKPSNKNNASNADDISKHTTDNDLAPTNTADH